MSAGRRGKGRSLALFLEDIRHHLERISRHTGAMTEHAFRADDVAQSVVIHSLIVIGEAARTITGAVKRAGAQSQAFQDGNRELWETLLLAGDMRNILTHEYFRVDPGVVWNAVTLDLPRLADLLRPAMVQAELERAMTGDDLA